jgi:hypothetical protein
MLILCEPFDQISDPAPRADVALQLGTAYLYMLDADRALRVWREARVHLPDVEQDRKQRLEAAILDVMWVVPGRDDPRLLSDLQELPPHDSTGGRLLDCAIASRDMALCEPAAVPRARRALADDILIAQANGDGALLCGWITLLAADDDSVMQSINTAIQHAYDRGALYALTPAYCFRALGWLGRGQLAEAEHDARESRRLAEIAQKLCQIR